MNNNCTEELKQETQRAKREMNRVTRELFAEKVMEDLEEQRKNLQKNYRVYTQQYVAEKAGISLSTYKGYVMGRSHHIDLITAKGIADILGCRLSDIIEKAEH